MTDNQYNGLKVSTFLKMWGVPLRAVSAIQPAPPGSGITKNFVGDTDLLVGWTEFNGFFPIMVTAPAQYTGNRYLSGIAPYTGKATIFAESVDAVITHAERFGGSCGDLVVKTTIDPERKIKATAVLSSLPIPTVMVELMAAYVYTPAPLTRAAQSSIA